MTSAVSESPCVLCERQATEMMEPARRTLARGLDPNDPSYSVTVILPDFALCAGTPSTSARAIGSSVGATTSVAAPTGNLENRPLAETHTRSYGRGKPVLTAIKQH